jgi:hypothetical protein
MKISHLIDIVIIFPALLICFLTSPSKIYAQSPTVIEVGKFSAATVGDTLPPDWKPLTFKKIEKHTTYTLVKDNDSVVVKAVAEASALRLTREIKINPKEYPIIQLRCKITNIMKKGVTHRKENGSAKVNQWANEERNVYEDYKKAFGEEPPMISGVAIMTDTDNAGESAIAYYGDILLKNKYAPHPSTPTKLLSEVLKSRIYIGLPDSKE